MLTLDPAPVVKATNFVGEAEAYALLARAGLFPPRHALVGDSLAEFAVGEPVVLKGLGEELWHKSELDAVQFMPFRPTEVIVAAEAMRRRIEAAGHRWLGGLVCERIAKAKTEGLPVEGFISLSRGEAGWVVLCGFGGLPAEALAQLAPPLRWPLVVTSAATALAELQNHLLGRIWLGQLRGSHALTTESQLRAMLEAIWRLAAVAEGEGLTLLELNPVVPDADGWIRPLDAVGRRELPRATRLAPPPDFLDALRAPRRVALAGVSAKASGLGFTVLENLRRCPALAGRITLIKPGCVELQGLPCVADVAALKADPVDLLLLALPAPIAAKTLGDLIDQGGGARVVALVCGGIGDGADHGDFGRELAAKLQHVRAVGEWTPVVLGPNFLGHWVPAAGLDTSFISTQRLAPPEPAGGGLVLLAQSGAFLLSRRSRAPWLRFGLGVALGNQMDAALPDFLHALADDPACTAVGAYVEGFGPGLLLETAQAVQRLRARGVPVLLHRGGFTTGGQAAAASHTGAMAGDWALERALLERAGVCFADSIAAFDAALEWLASGLTPPPGPVALMTNAGCESVNGGDRLNGDGLQAATLDAPAQTKLEVMLASHQLLGLVAPRLPLDLTPMSGPDVYLAAADVLLGAAGVLLVGLVPFAPLVETDPAGADRMAKALADLRTKHGKPVAVIVDAGADYDAYRARFRQVGLPVFDRVEAALLGLRVLA
ncbi:MAG: acetate--CoA ligase family protein [Opitutaceae bacterium]|nr:acetate--CoA ligase family protein [Opitutaceae bacterium]